MSVCGVRGRCLVYGDVCWGLVVLGGGRGFIFVVVLNRVFRVGILFGVLVRFL